MAQQELFPDPEHEDLHPLPGWLRMNFDTMEVEVYTSGLEWVELDQAKKEGLI
jgi:hypothetical protein